MENKDGKGELKVKDGKLKDYIQQELLFHDIVLHWIKPETTGKNKQKYLAHSSTSLCTWVVCRLLGLFLI